MRVTGDDGAEVARAGSTDFTPSGADACGLRAHPSLLEELKPRNNRKGKAARIEES
jgi:hypothetical protein